MCIRDRYKVLSAVNTGNLVLSDDYFDKQVYSKDIGKYLNVNKNDFAYKMCIRDSHVTIENTEKE